MNQEFSITANIEPITFTPELPSVIKKNQLSKFSLFLLSNYTYTTIQIDDEYLSFEAGFGSEIWKCSEIPLHAVFQIVVGESIIYFKFSCNSWKI